MDGLELGFKSIIISDATKAIDETNYKNVMQRFTAKGGSLINSSELNLT